VSKVTPGMGGRVHVDRCDCASCWLELLIPELCRQAEFQLSRDLAPHDEAWIAQARDARAAPVRRAAQLGLMRGAYGSLSVSGKASRGYSYWRIFSGPPDLSDATSRAGPLLQPGLRVQRSLAECKRVLAEAP
jgi:hypothetical protein